MQFSNKLYNFLKYATTIGLPALGTLYFALSTIWGLPYGELVVGTTSALTVFLGTLIGISTASYNSVNKGGELNVVKDAEGNIAYTLGFENLEQLTKVAESDQVILKVNSEFKN